MSLVTMTVKEFYEEAVGVSQADIAKVLGITRGGLSAAIQAERALKPSELAKLAPMLRGRADRLGRLAAKCEILASQ